MKKPPHFESLGEFDHYCKKALEHEAIDYLREMGKLRSRQKSLSSLTQEEMARLSSEDSYPSSSYVFSAHGYNLLIDNEMVAEAFAELEEQERSILMLYCVLNLTDEKIGKLMGLSRSTVQRYRTKSLEMLREKLAGCVMKRGRNDKLQKEE